jgi:hypothetical protein
MSAGEGFAYFRWMSLSWGLPPMHVRRRDGRLCSGCVGEWLAMQRVRS